MSGSNPMLDKYCLLRDGSESERLDMQCLLFGRTLEYQLAPWVQEKLGADARIADVATGTAAWIREVSETVPRSVEFHGWDISDAQFPAAGSLPVSAKLHVHNAMEPFPEEYHGYFDVVHIRMLLFSLDKTDWEVVARHCLQLLKPGGWMQWDELDLTLIGNVLRGRVGATRKSIEALMRKCLEMQGARMAGVATLCEVLGGAGFAEVELDRVCNDRVTELRDAWTANGNAATRAMLTACRRMGLPNSWSEEELQTVLQGAEEDRRSGTYYHCYLMVVTGRRPSEQVVEGARV